MGDEAREGSSPALALGALGRETFPDPSSHRLSPGLKAAPVLGFAPLPLGL